MCYIHTMGIKLLSLKKECAQGRGKLGVIVNRYRVSVWQDEKISVDDRW